MLYLVKTYYSLFQAVCYLAVNKGKSHQPCGTYSVSSLCLFFPAGGIATIANSESTKEIPNCTSV